jgi:EpsI family protein
MTGTFWVRALVLALALLGARHVIEGRSAVETLLRAPLAAFPRQLGGWAGHDEAAFAPEVERTLGADDYINRVYVDGRTAVGLYVAFYAAQRHGDAIHSPQHCLPGTGWEPVSRDRLTVATASGAFAVNRYVVQKRRQRQLVLYWFEGRGRILASEYANKFHLLADGLLRRRTDGAIVRVIAPVVETERAAEEAALRFLRVAHPHLREWLP